MEASTHSWSVKSSWPRGGRLWTAYLFVMHLCRRWSKGEERVSGPEGRHVREGAGARGSKATKGAEIVRQTDPDRSIAPKEL